MIYKISKSITVENKDHLYESMYRGLVQVKYTVIYSDMSLISYIKAQILLNRLLKSNNNSSFSLDTTQQVLTIFMSSRIRLCLLN